MRSRGGVAGITTDKKAQKKERDLEEKLLEAGLPLLSRRISLLISLRKSTPPLDRQLNSLISDSKQQIDDFAGDLTCYD